MLCYTCIKECYRPLRQMAMLPKPIWGKAIMRLQIDNVTKKYGSTYALNDLSLSIESGGIFGLVGRNGAGKSTLMKILVTLEKPAEGTVRLDDIDIIKNPNAIRRVLGYLPQDAAIYPNLTSFEFLSYVAAMKGIGKKAAVKHINELLDMLNLAAAKKKRLSSYSGGMRQRVGIACALLGMPEIIIMDEPSTGLDPEERYNLRQLLMELAKTRIVILSTHIISDIESAASNLAVMNSGRLLYTGDVQSFALSENGDIESAYLKLIHKGEAR